MQYNEYHQKLDKIEQDSINIVSTSRCTVWDTDAIVCGFTTRYEDGPMLVLRMKDGSVSLRKEDVQGFIQYLTIMLPMFEECNKLKEAYNETMKLENED